jgi:hypothetical protein
VAFDAKVVTLTLHHLKQRQKVHLGRRWLAAQELFKYMHQNFPQHPLIEPINYGLCHHHTPPVTGGVMQRKQEGAGVDSTESLKCLQLQAISGNSLSFNSAQFVDCRLENELRKMMAVATSFFHKWRFAVSAFKTQVVAFGAGKTRGPLNNHPWSIEGRSVDEGRDVHLS